jgi:hypothetical protein
MNNFQGIFDLLEQPDICLSRVFRVLELNCHQVRSATQKYFFLNLIAKTSLCEGQRRQLFAGANHEIRNNRDMWEVVIHGNFDDLCCSVGASIAKGFWGLTFVNRIFNIDFLYYRSIIKILF